MASCCISPYIKSHPTQIFLGFIFNKLLLKQWRNRLKEINIIPGSCLRKVTGSDIQSNDKKSHSLMIQVMARVTMLPPLTYEFQSV